MSTRSKTGPKAPADKTEATPGGVVRFGPFSDGTYADVPVAEVNRRLTNQYARAAAAPCEDLSLLGELRLREAGLTGVAEIAAQARHGLKFKDGRKAGTVGPVRQFVRKYLSKHPQADTAEVWIALKRKPPKGLTVHDPFERSKRRIDWSDGPTSYPQFRNIVSSEKGLLAK